LAWRIELDAAAVKELSQLDKPIAQRITAFPRERLAVLDDPRSIGEALKGVRLGNLWKHRVGDYRLIAAIEDSALTILVVRIGNRRNVYRK